MKSGSMIWIKMRKTNLLDEANFPESPLSDNFQGLKVVRTKLGSFQSEKVVEVTSLEVSIFVHLCIDTEKNPTPWYLVLT